MDVRTLRPAGCRPYQPCNKNRICAYTFVKEKDLPEGQKLFRCGKCLETFYVDRESQRAHWVESHGQVCCSLEKDDRRVREGFESIEECFDAIASTFNGWRQHRRTFPKGRLILHAFKELKDYSIDLKLKDYANDHIDLTNFQSSMKTVAQCFDMIVYFDAHGMDFFRLLWSGPGFASHFLSDKIFLSPTFKAAKEKDGPLPEKKEFYTENNEYIHCKIIPGRHKLESEVYYCLTVANLFELTEYVFRFEQESPAGGLLPKAVARNVFDCWICPFSRASFPNNAHILVSMGANHKVTRSAFYMGFIFRHFIECSTRCLQGDEASMWMSFKQAFLTSMEDECFFSVHLASIENFCHGMGKILEQLNEDAALERYFSVEDRWELLKTWSIWKPCRPRLVIANKSCLGSIYCSWIIGKRASVAIKLYHVAKQAFAAGEAQDQKVRLGALVEIQRSRALRASKRLTAVYTEVMQQIYDSYIKENHIGSLLPLPEDVEELIAEFAANEIIEGL